MWSRTGQMVQEGNRRRAPAEDQPHWAEISGRRWRFNPGDDQVSPCYTREQHEDQGAPPGYHACTPHPHKRGRVIYWIFLLAVICLIVMLVL